MSRQVDQVHATILEQLVPPGWAFSRDPASVTGGFFRPLADASSAFEAQAEALVQEADLRQAVNLLADYERVLGPDPCIAQPLPLAMRQLVAWQRWVEPQGASIGYFTRLAARLGVPIQIEEFPRLAIAGRLRAGRALRSSPHQFYWRVHLAPTVVTKFRAGASRAGDFLGSFSSSFVECVIRRNAPAQTIPLFAYDLPVVVT